MSARQAAASFALLAATFADRDSSLEQACAAGERRCASRDSMLFQLNQVTEISRVTMRSKLAPGCYLKQPTASSKCGGPFLEWERDTWGEANADSGTSEDKCLDRKAGHDGYCGTDTEWRFVAEQMSPGCYFKQPTSSSKCGGPFVEWERDAWGEENMDSGASEEACTSRKDGHDGYCGTNTEWLFVPAEDATTPTRNPTKSPTAAPTNAPTRAPTAAPSAPSPSGDLLPGCYFKQPTASAKCGGPFPDWERDAWGMENAGSAGSESACMERKAGHDSYCGTDTEWLFVAGSRGIGGNILTVMSYNTQYNNYGSRVGGYGAKIKDVRPSTVGTQECQDKYALARTSGYSVVPDTDFQNPIFYDPAVVSYISGSAGWMSIPRDNYSPRTLTWAKFRYGDFEFLHFNTHLPHNHGEAYSRNTHARIAQSLLQKRRELGEESTPTVVTGDMNTFASNGASMGSFESNLVDAGFLLSHEATGRTGGHAGLDQIFHTRDHFTLLQGADRGTGGSDHPAIIADLSPSAGR